MSKQTRQRQITEFTADCGGNRLILSQEISTYIAKSSARKIAEKHRKNVDVDRMTASELYFLHVRYFMLIEQSRFKDQQLLFYSLVNCHGMLRSQKKKDHDE